MESESDDDEGVEVESPEPESLEPSPLPSNSPTPSSPPPQQTSIGNNVNNQDDNGKLSKKTMLIIMIILLLVFAFAFFGTWAGLAVFGRDGKTDVSSAGDSVSIQQDEGTTIQQEEDATKDEVTKTEEPTLSSQTPVEGFSDQNNNIALTVSPLLLMTKEEVRSFLLSVVPDEGATLSDSTSPQSQALDWLWNDLQKTKNDVQQVLPRQSFNNHNFNTINNNKYLSEIEIIQRYVLAVLYYSTTGEGWNNNLGFLSEETECDWGLSEGYIPTWYGSMNELSSHCDSMGNIVLLSFSENDLLGTIPEELSLLTNLQYLLLRDNPLFGTIPTQLGELTKLQILNIVSSTITGPIPTEFGQFHLLDILDLNDNSLSGTIPTELGELKSLESFHIQRNPNIHGNVPEQLGNMRSAEDISISFTSLTGIVPSSICNIRDGRVRISTVCDQSQLVCCCCSACETVSYGSGTICDYKWSDECEICNDDVSTEPPTTPIRIESFAALSSTAPLNSTNLPFQEQPLLELDYHILRYRVIDAEYSKSMDRIIMISTDSFELLNELHVYDPESGEEFIKRLSLTPNCLSVDPSGTMVAVGHNGWVSYVNLTGQEEEVQTFPVTTNVFDIVLAGNGYIYAFPERDQWESIRCIDTRSGGTETTNSGGQIYARTRARLHPSGTKMYGADNGLSPSDLERYDITSGTANLAYDSPYHGDFPVGGNLWISEDGGRIFTKRRNVFRSSAVRDMDMLYGGNLGDTTSSSIKSLDHSSGSGKIVLIPENVDTEVEIYDDAYLTSIDTIPLPSFQVNNQDHKAHGKFIFFDSSGQNYHVIVEADVTANMALDHAVITIPTDITGTFV